MPSNIKMGLTLAAIFWMRVNLRTVSFEVIQHLSTAVQTPEASTALVNALRPYDLTKAETFQIRRFAGGSQWLLSSSTSDNTVYELGDGGIARASPPATAAPPPPKEHRHRLCAGARESGICRRGLAQAPVLGASPARAAGLARAAGGLAQHLHRRCERHLRAQAKGIQPPQVKPFTFCCISFLGMLHHHHLIE
ncbi:hypothetical protein B0H15DRAFT_957831 [Mycena belliarum]|uniref:Uncharacterized protein n=1 Tax=Mycena belliarum TaxID=1033014 RepID=A0AAD6TP22_9AGAR|nr:hypothetical protein B0H15DRAFT_957831 [Mycena belliae]